MVSLAMPVGCRTNSSLRCANGMCLPPSATCDGVEYCTDGSTFDILCGELIVQRLHMTLALYYYDCDWPGILYFILTT